MSAVAESIGWMVMAGAGLCVALAVLMLLFLVTGYAGKRVYERITRIYAFHTIIYWLERLEKEGTHCFEKAAPAVSDRKE